VAALSGKAISAALLSAPWNVVMTQKGFRQLANAQEAGIIYPPGGLAVQSSKLQKDRSRVRQVIYVLSDALKFIEEDKPWVVGYIQKTWKLNANAAEDAYRQTLPLLVMNGRLGFDEVQSFLDSAYENKEISERADSKQLVDYSILDEVIKERRGR
jgi:ABC-type nitrate/sulfonate/bicarbonate transport system substrate-binding protein